MSALILTSGHYLRHKVSTKVCKTLECDPSEHGVSIWAIEGACTKLV